MDIADAISLSVAALYVICILFYVVTHNPIHLIACAGMFGTTLLSEGIKHGIIKECSPRPKGATNCNMWCNDGPCGGQPGMPSGHSAQVAFFSGFYMQYTDNRLIQAGLTLYAGLVMLSRYLKRCHTIYQIGAGASLGFLLSLVASKSTIQYTL